MSDTFTITLSSSDKSFDDNTRAVFRVCLPAQISLEGKWAVGLSEMHYTRSWFNVPADEPIGVSNRNGKSITASNPLKAGHYEPEELVKAVTDCVNECVELIEANPLDFSLVLTAKAKQRNLSGQLKAPTISLNGVSRRTVLTHGEAALDNQPLFLDVTQNFANMLGLTNQASYHNNEIQILNKAESVKGVDFGVECYDLNYGIHALYVYCSLVSSQILGSTLAPLLRIVPADNLKFGSQCHHVYNKPYFYPLACNTFQVVEAEIRDKTGEPIDFKFGDTTLVLEFRRIK